MSDPICPTCKKPITDEDAVMHHNCLPPMTQPDSKKAREWWIADRAFERDEQGLERSIAFNWPTPAGRGIHVIEKSAYDTLCAERDKLRAALEKIVAGLSEKGPRQIAEEALKCK